MSDVDSSPRFGHICLQLLSEFLLREPLKVSLLPLYFLYPLLQFDFLCEFTCWEKGEQSDETLTLPWPFLLFSFPAVISARIIIWKSTPQLSHFPGIWLCGLETLEGAGLVGLCKARAGECIYSPLPPKCHLSCS